MCASDSKMEQIKALKNGKGIQYLLNKAYEILENPLLVHDMEYKIIAYTENIVTDDPIWNEFTTTGTISHDRLEFYKNENFLDAAANAERVTFLLSDKLKYARILGKLFSSENIQIGIAAIEAHKPFIDGILELFQCFCDVLNKEITKSEYYRHYGQAYQEILINKLIDGAIEDRQIYPAHVGSLYTGLKDNLFLAVADTSLCSVPANNTLPYFRDLFKHAQSAFKYSIYAHYIVFIISSDDDSLNIKRDLKRLRKLFEENDIYVGISNCFDNLYELQKYYKEAVSALNDGLQNNRSLRIFQYDLTAHNPTDS